MLKVEFLGEREDVRLRLHRIADDDDRTLQRYEAAQDDVLVRLLLDHAAHERRPVLVRDLVGRPPLRALVGVADQLRLGARYDLTRRARLGTGDEVAARRALHGRKILGAQVDIVFGNFLRSLLAHTRLSCGRRRASREADLFFLSGETCLGRMRHGARA